MPYRRKGSETLYIRVAGVRISAGTTNWADAEALEAKERHNHWLTQRMGVKPRHSWKEAAVRWCRENGHKVEAKRDIQKLKWLDQYLGGCRDVGEITRDQVDGFILSRPGVSASERKPENSTANRYVALISSILIAAERDWKWGNSAPRLIRYREPDGEQRWLTPQEWKLLSPELPGHLRLAATFSLCTGMREAKVFGLRWNQVDQEKRSLRFAGTENKIGNSIPLNVTALSILMECRSLSVVSPEHVFLYQGHRMVRHGPAWAAAFERAGVAYMRWHGLRGTFNSWLAQAGVPREIRMRLVGHTTGDVHDRYTHLAVEHLRPYASIIDGLLAEPAEERKQG